MDRLQVPGSAAALLEFRLGEEDRPAVGFAVHVPHYLAQAAYPAAAVTLLDSVARATGLQLPDEALREAAEQTDEEIRRQVEGSEEITEVVQALERQYDAYAEGAGRDGSATIPVDASGETGVLARAFARAIGETSAKTVALEHEIEEHRRTEAARPE